MSGIYALCVRESFPVMELYAEDVVFCLASFFVQGVTRHRLFTPLLRILLLCLVNQQPSSINYCLRECNGSHPLPFVHEHRQETLAESPIIFRGNEAMGLLSVS